MTAGPGLRLKPGLVLVSDLNLTLVDAVLHALKNPDRRRVLILVRDEERAAGEITAEFAVTWPAVSHHLRVLKDAGLLTERRKGQRRLYRTRPEGLAGVRVFLDQFRDDD
jgi:DNA-binding transcriptional ArsR family regulator